MSTNKLNVQVLSAIDVVFRGETEDSPRKVQERVVNGKTGFVNERSFVIQIEYRPVSS